MKVTIAVDDISLPLPLMRTPGRAPAVLEIVCEMLADHGVDDVHIIIAPRLHRRMNDWRDQAHGRRRRCGTTTGRTASTTTTPATPTAWSCSARRRHGELVEMNKPRRRERPRHLREPQPRADGRRPQVGGRRPVRLREPQGAPQAEGDRRVQLVHGSAEVVRCRTRSSAWASSSRSTLKVFHIETVLNNRMFDGPLVVPHEERGRLHRGRSPEVPGDEVDARQAAVARAPRDLHAHAGRLRAHRLLRRRVRADARQDAREAATSSTASRSRARPTS